MGNAAPREVRLGLVLNGGVSLAIWIGGVTKEIGAAQGRTSAVDDPNETGSIYAELCEILDQEVIVDVIAGASAGGVNGVLLAAATFRGKPLQDLRETWIDLGDFRRLLRSPSPPNPPSLMRGDDVVLPKLEQVLKEIYTGGGSEPGHPLYLYVTATDLFGFPHGYHDSTRRRFVELDHRHVLTFQHEPGGDQSASTTPQPQNAIRNVIGFRDRDASKLLARAARGSSSFPVAFEAHRLAFDDGEGDGKTRDHLLVDGGILDNQPFTPVLDRISVVPADRSVRRVVLYVVPYVSEVGTIGATSPDFATARETYAAAGELPRTVPKLQSLERITAEHDAQENAEEARRRLSITFTKAQLQAAARQLFPSYAWTRYTATRAIWELWASPDFRPGGGVWAQDPVAEPHLPAPPADASLVEPKKGDLPRAPGHARSPDWNRGHPRWRFGLSPAERVAAWALLFLTDADEHADDATVESARECASALIWRVRKAKQDLYSAYAATDDALSVDVRAAKAYRRLSGTLRELQQAFVTLDERLEDLSPKTDPEVWPDGVQDLLYLEIVRNALSIQDVAVPFPFTFIFASAGVRNSIGHGSHAPETKLAGMKLNHFGGFLKRSWRANDWLWGRLDGVEHVLRAIFDGERVLARAQKDPDVVARLAKLALPDPDDSPERAVLEQRWKEIVKDLGLLKADVQVPTFADVLKEASGAPDDKRVEACRRALAARLQLRILRNELARVAQTAQDDLQSGSSRIANGAYWSSRFMSESMTGTGLDDAARLRLFRDLDIGRETLADESSARLTFDVGSQGIAVAAAMLAGDRGGLPGAARGFLASFRGLTLAASMLTRLLARAPVIGAAAFTILVGLVVWAGLSKGTVVGALFPALAILAVVSGVALLTIATSTFERSVTRFGRIVGFAAFAGLPLAFAALARWPGWTTVLEPLDEHFGVRATSAAAGCAVAATGVALARLAVAVKPERPAGRKKRLIVLEIALGTLAAAAGAITAWTASGNYRSAGIAAVILGALLLFRASCELILPSAGLRRTVIGYYRLAVLLALGALAIGFVAKRLEGTPWADVADEHKGTILVVVLVAVLLLAALFEEFLLPVGWWLSPRVRRLVRKTTDAIGLSSS